MTIKCLACGKDARWCGDLCGVDECSHIHCDHCGMHYSYEGEYDPDTYEDAVGNMLEVYSAKDK